MRRVIELPVPRPRMLESFRKPGYPRLWLASVLFRFGEATERIAIGWFVLDQTDSVFLTTVAFAVRVAPSMVLGPVGGTLADRVDRRRLLARAALAKAAGLVLIGALIVGDTHPVWALLLIVAWTGTANTVQISATQALITDLVGAQAAMNAVGLSTLGARAVGIVGALLAGALIGPVGPGPVFFLAAIALLCAAPVYGRIPPRRPATSAQPRRFRDDLVQGIRTIVGIRTVALLLSLAVVIEILAFSFMSVLPALARDVLDVGPAGLGTLAAAVGVGSLLGSAVIVFIAATTRRGLLLIAVVLVFGALLVGLGSSPVFGLSLVIAAGVGAMAVMFDALQWILLQAHVPDDLRGRVLGGWVAVIGLGWAGHLMLGGLSEAMGVQWALVAMGAAVTVVGIAAGLLAPTIRRA